jgi:predicted GNAT family acetyltransferase
MQITKEMTATRGRYVATIDGIEAELTFSIMSPTTIIADHTGVPDALGGRGVGKALVDYMINDAKASGFRIVPLCPFVKAQYARDPEWAPVMNGR